MLAGLKIVNQFTLHLIVVSERILFERRRAKTANAGKEFMSWNTCKLFLLLLIFFLISGACSKDSSEEFGGGGSTAATATNFKVNSTIPEDNATKVAVNASFVISFSNDVKNSSVSESNFSLSSTELQFL